MGKVNLPKGKVKAFTLVETIVALVIILVIFGVATTIFVRTGLTNISLQSLQAGNVLQSYIDSTERDRAFINGTEEQGEFILSREVTGYSNYDSLLKIHYYIYDRNKKLLLDWQLLTQAGQ